MIVNTCAVTSEAVRQAAQRIRGLRREYPSKPIVVTGCAAQIDPDRFSAMPEVDFVIGNAEKMRADTFAELAMGNTARVFVNDIMSVRETAPHMLAAFGALPRAFVQIQNGCDHRCTFCIIPFGRGPSRSVPAGDVVNQVRRLVESGCSEIVLTGVDITSYGPDLPGGMSLGRLVKQVLKHVPELPRLRLSSIDQIEVDRDLLDAIADEPRLMPHLHLSIQSGDDMILKRMKRRHRSADTVRFCAEARRLRPDIVFGADLIAGFPTETEAMFENSLQIMHEAQLTFLHVFPFSPRTGTPAARMPQVPKAEIKARAARLRAEAASRLRSFLGEQVGRTTGIMLENGRVGRTPQFVEVDVSRGHGLPAGAIVGATIDAIQDGRLQARIAA